MKEHSDSKNKYSENDIMKMLEFLVDYIFVVFARKVFQHTVGILMCTDWAPLLVSISVQSHFLVHRWCFVHKLPRIRKLSVQDASSSTCNQGHNREQHFCFLPRFTSVDCQGLPTLHFYLRQTSWYQFPHHKLSLPIQFIYFSKPMMVQRK